MFDKDLFLYLCDKYDVELSATNTEPMVRNKDGTYDSLSDRIKEEFGDLFNDFDEDQNRIIDELVKLGLNNTEIVK